MARGHGTYNYATNNKCACCECGEAVAKQREYQRNWQKQRREAIASGEYEPTHGKVASYTQGCRCTDRLKAVRDSRFPARAAKYGLTVEEYWAIHDEQLGVCAICRNVLGERTAVDHDHETGTVRGLLCINCNTGLGKLGDSIESLELALTYLRKAKLKETN